ncbi:hypothetical protein Dsin_026837 [Dipteronia sinensis]|uniref:Pentatricopeptide repeat-containing protein n=1 Tax=Dipteronia sinensis TaxID=43782 RepID=A0AAE0DY92_9ROSI|nr:hypothetical protein Dsin_026837 [Dipteronia sinensis]
MRLSQGGIFFKLKAMLMPKHPISTSTSTLLLRRFSSSINDDDSNNRNNGQNPPEPIPNRPLRGERPFNSHNHPQGRPQLPKLPDHVQSDTSFLEKFKLAADNKTENPPQNDTAERKTGTLDQAAPQPPQDADEIFKKMKETGLIPNAVAMLDGLCKDGLVHEAMKLFGQMRERGTIPEVVIYTAVVDGFCKAHKFDDAVRIFRKMQTTGISPNAFTYTVLIQGLCNSNKLEDAIDYSIEMLEAGHSPNVITFVGLVDGLCREKGVEEARSVIATLTQKGFHVNDKAVRDFLDKKAPFLPSVWEAIFGKKIPQKPF